MKTYLVTGGAGFIGSNFIHYLFQKYDEQVKIINFDKLTYAGNLENLKGIESNSNYQLIRGDICDRQKVEEIFKNNQIDYVINFAAESHVDRSIKNPEIFVRTNILGTQVLLNVAKKFWETEGGFIKGKKFLQVSTDEVYGSLGPEGFFTETTPLDPRSPYSASKASADLLVKAYFDTYQIPVNITRCSNNYGPYQFPEKLIPLMINNCLSHKALPIYGDGRNVRDWLYVEDHCRAIDIVLKKGKIGEVYNIGGNNEKENIQLVKTIIHTLLELLPKMDIRRQLINEGLIQYVTDRKGHDRRYAIDFTKIKNELNWEPEIKFNDGIVKTIQWYLQNEKWLRQIGL